MPPERLGEIVAVGKSAGRRDRPHRLVRREQQTLRQLHALVEHIARRRCPDARRELPHEVRPAQLRRARQPIDIEIGRQVVVDQRQRLAECRRDFRSAWNGVLVIRMLANLTEALRDAARAVLPVLVGRPIPRVWTC